VWIIKASAVVAMLGTAAAGWWLLSTAEQSYRLTGTLAVQWNPALAMLLVAEGHNDALVMALVVLSLALTVRQFVVLAWLVQSAAILTKYFPSVLLPLQLAFWWRTRSHRRELVIRLLLATALGICLGVVLYSPYWIGLDTFFGTGALGGGQPTVHMADLHATLLLAARLAVVALAIALGMWYASSPARLIEACAGVALISLFAGPQRFWPWYACVPLALMALTPRLPWRWPLLVTSACVLLASPIEALPIGGDGLISFEFQSFVFHAVRLLPLVALTATLLTYTMRANRMASIRARVNCWRASL
jgi:hypothetical protein